MADLGASGEVVDDQAMEVGAVGDRDMEEEVVRARHRVERESLRQSEHRGRERRHQLPAVRAQLHGDERLQAAADGGRIDHCPHCGDHAELPQPPHPLVTR